MAITKKKIRSKIALDYNTGLRTSANSIVEGRIVSVAYSNNFETLAVSFNYLDNNGALISRDVWNIEGQSNIDSLMAQIAPLLPPTAGETQDQINKFYQGFLLVAADSWSNDPGDWEIIDDI